MHSEALYLYLRNLDLGFANILTLFRLLVCPIFYAIYTHYSWFNITFPTAIYLLIGLLAISELSDFLDGHIARKYNQVTDVGKILDPMADSISRICVFLTFTLPPVQLPIIYIFVFLYRDSIIASLRTICALKGFALAARRSGKLKAVILAVVAFAILFLLIGQSRDWISSEAVQAWSFWLVTVAAIYSILSGVEYIVVNYSYIKSAFLSKRESKRKK